MFKKAIALIVIGAFSAWGLYELGGVEKFGAAITGGIIGAVVGIAVIVFFFVLEHSLLLSAIIMLVCSVGGINIGLNNPSTGPVMGMLSVVLIALAIIIYHLPLDSNGNQYNHPM